jgi:hypothetical protein
VLRSGITVIHEGLQRMEKLKDGFISTDHRQLRLSFKPPRDITHPDLAVAGSQIARGDRQLFDEAKKHETINRRVWFFCTFPCDSSTSKSGKTVVKVDLLIASPYGAMVLKVLDWSGPCNTNPGEKWFETRSDGTKVEHPNQLTELDTVTQWARIHLEKNGVCPSNITSYVLFSSPQAKPSFVSDPRIVIGSMDCAMVVRGNGPKNELEDPAGLFERGTSALKGVLGRIPSASAPGSSKSSGSRTDQWLKFQAFMDAMPQFDLLFLRKLQCYIFGRFEKGDDSVGRVGFADELAKFCKRKLGTRYRFEHSSNGLLSAPIALVTGGLGLEPSCRIHRASETNGSDYLDVSPSTKLIFRPFGCEGIVAAEANDVDFLELARNPRSMTTAEDGTDSGLVDQVGQFITGFVSKSLQSGVKSMLPFPLNALANQIS